MARQTAPAAVGLVAAAAASLWLWLTVTANFSRDPSALFYTGETVRLPPAIGDERIHRFPGAGYDGQFYHFAAHDPWMLRGFASYADNPRLRWRRILLPLLAWSAALGSDDYVDSLYWIVSAIFAGAGAFWLARLLAAEGFSPWFGLLFLIVPATAISLDRMTVDGVLAALLLACLVFEDSRRRWALWISLAAAPLARETGILFIAAYLLATRRWIAGLCALPAFAWWSYVHAHTGADLTGWTTPLPFAGLVRRAFEPVQFELTSTWLRVAGALDYLAVWGVLSGVCASFWLFRKRMRDPDRASSLTMWIAVLFSLAAAVLSKKDVWEQAYSFARIFSPMFLALALSGIRRRQWLLLLPLAAAVPRVLWQLAPQAKGVLHFFFGVSD